MPQDNKESESTPGAPAHDAGDPMQQEILRRQKAEDVARKAEAKCRALFDATSESIALVGLDGRVLEINQASRALTDFDPADVVGKHFTDLGFLPKDDIQTHIQTFSKLLLGQDPGAVEVSVSDIRGHMRILEVKASRINDGAELLAFLIVCRDITEQKHSDQIIQRKMEFERTISTISSRFVGRVDLDAAIHNSLGDACVHTGATRGYVWLIDEDRNNVRYAYEWCAPGQQAHKELMPILPNKAYAWGEAILQNGKSLYIPDWRELDPAAGAERALLRAMGIKSVFMLPLRMNDQILGYIGFNNTDTTLTWTEDDLALLRLTAEIIGTSLERRRAETALAHSEERFRRLAEASPDIIMRGMPIHGVDYANPALKKILGYEPEEIYGNYGLLASRMHPEDSASWLRQLQEIGLSGNPSKPTEVRIKAKSGDYVWIETVFVPLYDEAGILFAMEMLGRDITERKRAEQERQALEQQLVQAQKMEAVGTLAGGMAHEFNNMLAVIMGSAELCANDFPPDDPHQKRIRKIMDVAERARDITMKILTFARKEKVDVRPVSLNSIVADAADMLERSISRKIRVRVVAEENLPPVKADTTQLEQALLNVGLNSADAMPGGGQITFKTSLIFADADFRATHPHLPQGAWCAICIKDSGPGIPPDIIEKIFEPFFTTKDTDSGTGLGLAITLGIVRNHGGYISACNEPGGAAVYIFLPPAPFGAVLSDASPAAAFLSNTETVLVIDDIPDFLDITVEALDTEGFRPIPALGGTRAIELFREMRDQIDIVLLDMVMPETDGAKVFHAIKDMDPQARILLCSGYCVDGQISELENHGAAGFIQKPFRVNELCARIREILDRD